MRIGRPVICVVGPTASGKTELAQRIALRLNGEVVSADSMQVYRGMDIGTGKIAASDRKVPHHCIDIVNPGDSFSAALFQQCARAAIEDIDGRNKRALLCGGTGFYVRAAIDDYNFPKGEQVDNPVRDTYNAYAEENGNRALWELLSEKDPQSAKIIAENDRKRVVRAFELLEAGTSYAEQKEKLASLGSYYPVVMIGLAVDVDVLRDRIGKRVDSMVAQGLVQEVESLLEQGFRKGITARDAIGYKEIVAAIDGATTFVEAFDLIKQSTRQYAKRQRTWFRKDARINWIDATDADFDSLESQALAIIASHEEGFCA